MEAKRLVDELDEILIHPLISNELNVPHCYLGVESVWADELAHLVPGYEANPIRHSLKNEYLIRVLQKLDDHSNMVELRPRHSPQQLALENIVSKQQYVASLTLFYEVLFVLNLIHRAFNGNVFVPVAKVIARVFATIRLTVIAHCLFVYFKRYFIIII